MFNNLLHLCLHRQASRAQILKKAAEYIGYMRRKNSHIQADIDEISKSNQLLEEQSKSDDGFSVSVE